MSVEAERAAWADYWTNAGGLRPACMPNAKGGVEAAQRAVWTAFASTLPRRARVLDIGTGDGAVLAALSARRDLELLGVDNAPALPPPPRGVRLMANIAAEQLPFADGRFHAIVSQFGFEYADLARATPEAGRVLRAGGMLHMIVHHRDGPIVAHNRRRRDALLWALGEQDLIGRAQALVAARRIAPLPTPAAFRGAGAEAQTRFGPGTGADELAEAVWKTLEGGRGRAPAEVSDRLAMLAGRAEAEIVRIGGLLRAARDESEIVALSGEMESAGLAMTPPRALLEAQSDLPFAWLLAGRKDGAFRSR